MRRYGFHGLSYEYLLNSFREHEGEAAARGRLIFLHLGSGASISALAGGQPVDMSMGFTPVSGIMMSTRTGDIEPGVLIYMQQQLGLKPDEVFDIVAKQSGLLGISGQTGDMYTLLQSQHEDSAAALAIELFCYTIKKTIGAYTAVLGGITK
jgi:acetate kinase